MIHFKKLKRLLLVAGLLSTQALATGSSTTCSISVEGAANGPTLTPENCANGYYLIDPKEYTLTTEPGLLIKIDNSANPKVSIVSNPSPGFYKNGSGTSAQYIQCKSYGYCEVATYGSGNCSSSNKGVLTKNSDGKVVLCLGDFTPPQETAPSTKSLKRADQSNNFPPLEFLASDAAADNENYLVQHVKATGTTENVFSFDKSANFYAVKRDVNSIVFNNECGVTGALVEDKAALKTNGKLISRTDELCDIENSSGRYYTCTAGICISSKKTDRAVVHESNGETSVELKITISGETCTSQVVTDGSGVEVYEENGYLLDANNNKLAKYTKDGSGYSCNAVTEPGYYIKANHKAIIMCKSSDGSCNEINTTNDACDTTNNTNGVQITDYNAVVCIDSSTKTVQRFSGTEIKDHTLGGTGSAFGTESYYEVNVTKDSIVLDKSGGDITHFIQDKLAKTKIYECDPTTAVCKVLDDTYHYYEKGDKKLLYYCKGSDGDNECTATAMDDTTNPIKTGFYLAELKNNNNKYSKLIKCTAAEGTNPASCGNYTPTAGSTDASLAETAYATKGYYLDADQTPAVSARKRTGSPAVPSIIECTKEDESVTCKKNSPSLVPEKAYLNEGSHNENVIVCPNGDICAVIDKPSGNNKYYYLDATYTDNADDETQIITCTAEGCTTSGKTSPDQGVAYIDAAIKNPTDEDPNIVISPNLIMRGTDKKWISGAGSVEQGVAYIDGGVEPHKNVIICTESEGCVSKPGKVDGHVTGYVYINGINDDSTPAQELRKRQAEENLQSSTEKFANIIRCDEGNVCKSEEGSVLDGEAYIDATDNVPINVIKCTEDDGCKSDEGVGVDADTYVNALKKEQIINCIKDEDDTVNCFIITSEARDGRSEYYPTFNSGAKSLINCVYAENKKNCKWIDTTAVENPAVERRIDEVSAESEVTNESKGYDYNVFINGLKGKNEKTDKNPLIICNSDKECKSADANTSNPDVEKAYYLNYDHNNTEKNVDDLIVCTKGTDVASCSIIDGSNGKVYLNGNYNNSKNQIIMCTSDKGCEEVQTNQSEEGQTAGIEYYVNYGNVPKENNKLNGSLIKCTANNEACTLPDDVQDGYIYINAADTSSTIQCTTSKGCAVEQSWANDVRSETYLNYDGIQIGEDQSMTNNLIKCSKNEEQKVECKVEDGVEDTVFINSFDDSKLIKCSGAKACESVDSEADKDKPAYYYNKAAPLGKLLNNLIKCTKEREDGKATCSLTNAKSGDVYLNANIEKETNKSNLISCVEVEIDEENPPSESGCTLKAVTVDDNPLYYVNSGNPSTSDKLKKGLIQCTKDSDAAVKCEEVDAKENQIYINEGPNKAEKQIIKCTSSECTTVESKASDGNNEYYINSGDEEKDLKYDIIVCEYDVEKKLIECNIEPSSSSGVYINSNYNASGDKNQLIQCTSDGGCTGKQCTSTRYTEYYVNAESTDLDNAIISCASNKCEKITPESPSYFVGTDSDVNGLIECITTAADSTNPSTAGCTYKSPFTSQGYYLNAGFNRATNQTIICDVSEGCQTTKVELGIYVNAGEPQAKPIIKCEKEGSECTAYASPNCPSSSATDVVPGSYCYSDSQLKFYNTSNSTSIAASKADDYYVYATVSSDVFPGIRGSDVSSLFKVSHYYINRFFQSGVIIIDRNNKLVDNLVSGQSDIILYDCNDSTKVCTQRPGCTPNTYMFDSENRKAIFCNAGTLENAQFTGYVVDSTRAVGTNHPYIIKCDDNGKKCSSFKPKVTSYYENSGYDASTNNLILCSNNNCATAAAEIGYYVGREGTGIIQCTSATSCAYTPSKHKVKYVNAGANKSTYAIIDCIRGSCSAAKAKVGYYMTYSNSILIQCTSSSICAEFTPTVNYYDNADSSESSNSIINCVQNSQVISCALEATNNGFYMSSQPNVLIRCKSGSKCKTVTVKNGIFRGAIKGLVGGSKRSDAEVEAEAVKAREQESELEEDGQSVTMPRDSDEAYGIIRCVAGKCQALSASEVAAIPMCEFANNKCYITLEYAMTKSATTSISAGNICTNTDRSVFYFATDTIVVKPNVISGVTATYVYTTTNSNCLEVNDSYDDMYFTVGSNIYLLDQGSVLQFYESGYYFINTAKNTLVNGNDIDAYNDESVKLYKCNGSSCRIQDKPDSMTYYADVNKRILKYNVNSDSYSFAYNKDITCIFANNKCTPNADLKNQEFCITYKGELVLARADIKNRETGECYKASSINSNIYGYSQYLYQMNIYSAQMVDETGYYIVSLSTNSTVVSKNYKTKNNGIVVYGCQHSSCKIYEPEESTYYYDAQAKTLLRYRNGVWSTPSTSGYAYISLEPASAYIYRFTKTLDEIKINNMASYGYYYTVDQEMYHCNEDENGDCTEIDNSGYYFTNAGEVYQCVHDSENLEPTECTKQACISGQYYYIDEAYYRCELSSVLVPVLSRYCSYNENVVVNFPLALSEELPDKIKQAVEGIEKNNNSTAIIKSSRKNYLESVSGIFTNCTYNVEETKSTFDMVCVNNYVTVDEENDEVKICSIEQLGYVECVEDENNPEKCNVSGALSFLRPSLSTIFMIAISLIFYTLF